MKNTGQKPRYTGTRSPLDKVAQFHPYHVELWEEPNVVLRCGHYMCDDVLAVRYHVSFLGWRYLVVTYFAHRSRFNNFQREVNDWIFLRVPFLPDSSSSITQEGFSDVLVAYTQMRYQLLQRRTAYAWCLPRAWS